jgi:4-hydroxy-L-threonine phosphate dehydrogenase PdxA
MKTPALKNYLLWILLVLLLVFSGMKVYARHGAVVETFKKATAPVNDEERVDAVLTLPINTVLVKSKY